MERTKILSMVTEWKLIGMKSKGHPKNRWRGEVLDDRKN
jgi:hypothetical protein